MIGRLFTLALGAGLVALAVLINRPDLYGAGAPRVDLGLYETYRNMVGIAIGMIGGVILIAAILRKGGKAEQRIPESISLDLGDEPASEVTTHSRSFDFDAPMAAPIRRSGSGAAVASPLW